ncbi:hypothetical protein HPB47_023247 [Ixodes persulcatus]|uniref:Uncharacterized protein n=1 Tax=Ixodes persulcatus TaxID=34615 RepID=A0AC60Q7G3_IXOPE|nr:hypothetical protein HPB47_023247 [Ixodes persulcatus]
MDFSRECAAKLQADRKQQLRARVPLRKGPAGATTSNSFALSCARRIFRSWPREATELQPYRKKRKTVVVEAQVGLYLLNRGLDAAQIDTCKLSNGHHEILAVRTGVGTIRLILISACGYAITSPRGQQLADAYERANLLMVNDLTVNTRYWTNRRSGDTAPDLTLVTHRANATWKLSKDPTQSTPGPDFVSGSMLRNQPEGARTQLLKVVNDVCRLVKLSADLELTRQRVTRLPAARYQVRIMVAVDVRMAYNSLPHAPRVGLTPSPEKTEHLLFGKGAPATVPMIFDGKPIEKTDEHTVIRVTVNITNNRTILIRRMGKTGAGDIDRTENSAEAVRGRRSSGPNADPIPAGAESNVRHQGREIANLVGREFGELPDLPTQLALLERAAVVSTVPIQKKIGTKRSEKRRRCADKHLKKAMEIMKTYPEATVVYYVAAAVVQKHGDGGGGNQPARLLWVDVRRLPRC